MISTTIDSVNITLKQSGIDGKKGLLAMHMAEIEEEAHKLIGFLNDLRTYAASEKQDDAQDTLVEIAVSLEHFIHHAQYAIPEIETQLAILEEDEITDQEIDNVFA